MTGIIIEILWQIKEIITDFNIIFILNEYYIYL